MHLNEAPGVLRPLTHLSLNIAFKIPVINGASSITRYGFLAQLDAQVVALHAHRACTAHTAVKGAPYGWEQAEVRSSFK